MPDGAPFIAMELLEGMDLAHELHRRGGRLPIAEAVSYVVEACDGIAEAHARGIIHRDLKPSNLFLAKRAHKEPIIKVLDFGISKPTAVGQVPSALTGTAELLGSPLYMSPEQLRAPKDVDARSDVWSLAATLYELVSGKTPFDGPTLADLASNIMNAPPPDIRRRVPSAPDAFQDVILRALAKSPAARYATVSDFARALAPFGHAKQTVPMAAISPPVVAAPAVLPPASSSTKMLTAPLTPRDANRTLPMPPGSAHALAPVAPVAAASDPEPNVAANAVSAPRVHSLSGPLGLIGSLVAAIVIVLVVVTRTRDDPTAAPIASASSSASSVPSGVASVAVANAPPASSTEVADEDAAEAGAEAGEDAEDAAPSPSPAPVAVEPAPPPQPAPPPPPPSSASSAPDARVYESAGY
jgi:serine/threonine-protein kinase